MNIIQFKNNAPIRVQMIKGEPWFVAKDVCEVLDIKKYRDAILYLRDQEKGRPIVVDTLGGKQEMTSVNESGLYSLVFQSRKPAAQEFRYWVTSEVLPAIRKYGRYALPGTKERQRLEVSYERKERQRWLAAINAKLTFTDQDQIAKKLGCNSCLVDDVLRGRAMDTTVEAECMFRATRNAKLRRLLDDSEFRSKIIDEIA